MNNGGESHLCNEAVCGGEEMKTVSRQGRKGSMLGNVGK